MTCAIVTLERSSPTAAISRPDTTGVAITTTAYTITSSAGRGCCARPAYHTIAADTSTTTPRASAVGGIAARSAGVSAIGACIQMVNEANARPSTDASAT